MADHDELEWKLYSCSSSDQSSTKAADHFDEHVKINGHDQGNNYKHDYNSMINGEGVGSVVVKLDDHEMKSTGMIAQEFEKQVKIVDGDDRGSDEVVRSSSVILVEKKDDDDHGGLLIENVLHRSRSSSSSDEEDGEEDEHIKTIRKKKEKKGIKEKIKEKFFDDDQEKHEAESTTQAVQAVVEEKKEVVRVEEEGHEVTPPPKKGIMEKIRESYREAVGAVGTQLRSHL